MRARVPGNLARKKVGDAWTVARRAECVESDELAEEVADAVRPYGLRDVHPGNVGCLYGRPVLVDYGYPTEGNTYLLGDSSEDSEDSSDECNCTACRGGPSESDSYSESESDSYASD